MSGSYSNPHGDGGVRPSDPSVDGKMDDQLANPAKVFVGGLGQGTNDASLRAYFSQFGTVEDAVVVSDRFSQRSRGFGFCTFSARSAADRCLNARHKIDGVSCEVRPAVPRDEARDTAPYDSVEQPGKMFVGGLPDDVTEDRMNHHFAQYGVVREATLMYDKNNHRPRGFGFIVFENPADCEKAIGSHPSLGRACEAKKAEPRPDRRGGGGGRRPFDRFEPPPFFERWVPPPRGGDRWGGRYDEQPRPYDMYYGTRYEAPPPHERDYERYGGRGRYGSPFRGGGRYTGGPPRSEYEAGGYHYAGEAGGGFGAAAYVYDPYGAAPVPAPQFTAGGASGGSFRGYSPPHPGHGPASVSHPGMYAGEGQGSGYAAGAYCSPGSHHQGYGAAEAGGSSPSVPTVGYGQGGYSGGSMGRPVAGNYGPQRAPPRYNPAGSRAAPY